jgi:hypothetical protein
MVVLYRLAGHRCSVYQQKIMGERKRYMHHWRIRCERVVSISYKKLSFQWSDRVIPADGDNRGVQGGLARLQLR